MKNVDWLQVARGGKIVVSIGQIDEAQRRQLERAVRRGDLIKWRGFWHSPLSPVGIGPRKVCYGLPSYQDFLPAGAQP